MITDPTALGSLIAALVALAFVLERKWQRGRAIGSSLLVIILAALVSNVGLVPASSSVYDLIGGPLTSLAIVWLLIAVDLRALVKVGPRMLGAFLLAVAATATGALIASFALGSVLGDDTWRLAGVMTGTYAGGSLNFVAVGRAVELRDEIFAAAVASDNVLTAVWMGATLMLPLWLARWWPTSNDRGFGDRGSDDRGSEDGQSTESVLDAADRQRRDRTRGPEQNTAASLLGGRFEASLGEVAALIAIGLGISWVAGIAAVHLPGVSVLWLTTVALIVGLVPAVRRLRGSLQLGLLALHFFFAVIGIGSRLAEIVRVGPWIFVFTAIVIVVHGLLTFGVAHRIGLDLGTTAVASQAAVGGPSTALALAAARGWPHLAAPATLVGLLGYALGTYSGILVASLVRGLLG